MKGRPACFLVSAFTHSMSCFPVQSSIGWKEPSKVLRAEFPPTLSSSWRKCYQVGQNFPPAHKTNSLMLPHFISSFHIQSLLSAQVVPRISKQGKSKEDGGKKRGFLETGWVFCFPTVKSCPLFSLDENPACIRRHLTSTNEDRLSWQKKPLRE